MRKCVFHIAVLAAISLAGFSACKKGGDGQAEAQEAKSDAQAVEEAKSSAEETSNAQEAPQAADAPNHQESAQNAEDPSLDEVRKSFNDVLVAMEAISNAEGQDCKALLVSIKAIPDSVFKSFQDASSVLSKATGSVQQVIQEEFKDRGLAVSIKLREQDGIAQADPECYIQYTKLLRDRLLTPEQAAMVAFAEEQARAQAAQMGAKDDAEGVVDDDAEAERLKGTQRDIEEVIPDDADDGTDEGVDDGAGEEDE